MRIPYFSFEFINREIEQDILETFGRFFHSHSYILGNAVKNFEREYAKFNQTEYCIGVSNGLDALILALKSLPLSQGDEVIVPSNTYIATVLAVLHCGLVPVFVEPRLSTYNLDPNKIEAAITSRTKVIMPVHLYGQACEMVAIMDIASRKNLFIVEDNAQAHGATFNQKITGSFGNINATSFYPAKNLGALGDAGGITTDDEQLYQRAMILRNYGSSQKYTNEVIGYNARLDECQAAFLSVKLRYLLNWTMMKNTIAGWYFEGLKDVGDIILPQIAGGATSVFHIYMIRTKKRNELIEVLKQNGIETLIHYPIPPHLQNALKDFGYKKGDFPISEEIANTCLSLPAYPGISESEVDRVCKTIMKFYENQLHS